MKFREVYRAERIAARFEHVDVDSLLGLEPGTSLALEAGTERASTALKARLAHLFKILPEHLDPKLNGKLSQTLRNFAEYVADKGLTQDEAEDLFDCAVAARDTVAIEEWWNMDKDRGWRTET